jgi:hypothetical protein
MYTITKGFNILETCSSEQREDQSCDRKHDKRSSSRRFYDLK